MSMHALKRIEREPTEGDAVADSIDGLTRAVHRLGLADASTEFGALENLALEVRKGSERIARALDGLASEMANVADAIREHGE